MEKDVPRYSVNMIEDEKTQKNNMSSKMKKKDDIQKDSYKKAKLVFQNCCKLGHMKCDCRLSKNKNGASTFGNCTTIQGSKDQGKKPQLLDYGV